MDQQTTAPTPYVLVFVLIISLFLPIVFPSISHNTNVRLKICPTETSKSCFALSSKTLLVFFNSPSLILISFLINTYQVVITLLLMMANTYIQQCLFCIKPSVSSCRSSMPLVHCNRTSLQGRVTYSCQAFSPRWSRFV